MDKRLILRFIFSLTILYGAFAPAGASERHFGYSYESPVLPGGEKELESYSTFRFGRDRYYSALDQSLEFEVGLGGNVQTSLYLNFTQEMADQGGGNITTSFMADGIANEWKFRLKDSFTEDFGLGLYFENEFKPDEYELETKVILDKQSGPWLWTFNLTNEPEVHYTDNTFGYNLIPSLGGGLFLVPERFFLGLEAEDWNFWYDTTRPMTASILSAGPVFSYTAPGWWVTVTLLPQLANLKGGPLDFTTGQRMQARVAASFSFGSNPSPPASSLPEPTQEDSQRLGNGKFSLEDLRTARNLYEQRCDTCHPLHAPSEFTEEGWDQILETMGEKAGLSGQEKNLILAYLINYSKGQK